MQNKRMKIKDEVSAPQDIPKQVLGSFLDELKEGGSTKELIDRLRKVLIEENDLSEQAIRTAMFSDAQQ